VTQKDRTYVWVEKLLTNVRQKDRRATEYGWKYQQWDPKEKQTATPRARKNARPRYQYHQDPRH
jgi:hypothetical protein